MYEYRKSLRKFIPPGFSLENYTNANKLDLLGWLNNIEIRCYYRHYSHTERGRDGILDVINEGVLKARFPIIGSIRDLKLVDNLNCAETLSMVYGMTQDDGDIKPLIDSYYHSNGDDYWQAIQDLKAISVEGYLNNAPELGGSKLGAVTICLGYSDKEIEQAFSSWLKSVREKEKIKQNKPKVKVFSPYQLSIWSENRVLLYLDLSSWCASMGLNPGDAVIGEILFPDNAVKSDPSAIAAIATLVKKLTSEQTLNQIRRALL